MQIKLSDGIWHEGDGVWLTTIENGKIKTHYLIPIEFCNDEFILHPSLVAGADVVFMTENAAIKDAISLFNQIIDNQVAKLKAETEKLQTMKIKDILGGNPK